MDCIIEHIEKVERESGLPYFIIKAKGTQGDANASVLDANGFINPLACMSRVLNFTKTLFPATAHRCRRLKNLANCSYTL